jgi:hypothetical protein
VIDMKENGRLVRSMAMERIYSQMVVVMLDNILMVYRMAKESTIGLMEVITKEISSKA